MTMNPEQFQRIIEAALMVAGNPLSVSQLQKLFAEEAEQPTTHQIRGALEALREHYAAHSGVELHEVASGFQFQAKTEFKNWLARLWEERPARYSRALLETMALVAYRQPITRAEVEDVRGVAVSTNITKTLLEREWIRIVGYKDVPGKPALYGTTQAFLDHFNLKSLSELPTLAELIDLEAQEAKLQVQLELADGSEEGHDITDNDMVPLVPLDTTDIPFPVMETTAEEETLDSESDTSPALLITADEDETDLVLENSDAEEEATLVHE